MSTSAPALAHLVPVEALTVPRDRFRCERLSCVLSAQTCVDRQKRARVGDSDNGQQGKDTRSISFASCYDCPVGVVVQQRVPAAVAASPKGWRFSSLRIGAYRRHLADEAVTLGMTRPPR